MKHKASYVFNFTASRQLTHEEHATLSKKFIQQVQKRPFGEWQPEQPDHPELKVGALHKEIDPLLGYDKRWLVSVILDHLAIQRRRFQTQGVDSKSLAQLKFTLLRLDEFANGMVPELTDLRNIAEKDVY